MLSVYEVPYICSMGKGISLAVAILFSVIVQAQNTYIDSLRKVLRQATDIKEQILVQQQMADWYRSSEQYTEAVTVAKQSLETALKISSNNLEVVKAYWILSNIYTNMEDFEVARTYVDRAYFVAETQSDSLSFAYALYAEAMLQNTIFNTDISVKLLHQALAKIEHPEQEAALVTRIYYLLYGVYVDWNEADKAMAYADKAIAYAKLSGNKNLLANAYSARAVCYTYRYEERKEQGILDTIMNVLDEAIVLYQRYPGQVLQNTYSLLRVNKASYYLKYYNIERAGIRQQIRSEVTEALQASKNIEGNESVLASGYGILSELDIHENNLQGAESNLLLAYTMMVQKKKPYYYTLINVLNSLVKVSINKRNYQQALHYQQEIAHYSNLLFNEESASNTKRLEAQFDFKKKEQEIQRLTDQAESHRRHKALLIGLIGIGLLGAFFMFRSYHFNLRYSLAREKQLASENNETALQVKYEKEEKARLKAEQELLALQQQKLQDEIMASQLQLQHKSNVLHQLKEKFIKEEPANIRQLFREESVMDNDFEKVKFHIQELHPNFFRNIGEHAKQKLTAMDQKYCAYLYLGMETKQIAQLLHVEPKSVRMARYRLKQKFDLDAETDLLSYLKKMV
ncbi:hypothetical protein CLV99_4476 [Sphingobacterium yanglingense]|uniref:HTH luxR-type domain-containing protein n=2 Tax=Sphingobacterium yanglingense TaxID=1437280 RepID=A0A4R6W4C5_9SPHI|nr:hypothetical protein CLV99_4476 [Sphingobacterium yanglingense]